MKKISIVTPIYNEEANLTTYIESVKRIEYPRDDFEIIFVNDGSNDRSLETIHIIKNKNKDINITIIDLGTNKGRAFARYKGAIEAHFPNLIFLDCKCEIFENALKIIDEKDYQPIIGHVVQKKDSALDVFFFLVRSKVYKRGYNDVFEDFYFDENSFDGTPKGTGVLFVDRELFLHSQIDNLESKNSSDDTKLLRNIVSKKQILKTKDFKVYYNTRTSFKGNIIHMFHRGPKFIDYYYKPNNKYFWIINLSLFLLITTVVFLSIGYYKEVFLSLFLGLIIISMYLGKNIKEAFLVFCMFPIIYLTFMAGWVKGLFLKSFGKL